MIGYKLLNKDMKAIHGNNMQYELNKKYSMNKDDVLLYNSGYHLYESLEDCISSEIYDTSDSRFFKVETGKYIKDDIYNTFSKILVSNEITLLEEISKEDIINYCKENRTKIDNISLARLGLFLDELVNDENPYVRLEVAKQGKYLDILVYDETWMVRREIAGQGKCLDILVNDESSFVRREVARQCQSKYLDILVKDEDYRVRIEIVRQGKYLDELVKDKDSDVRLEVARQGKYLDILVNDEDWFVRREAATQLNLNKN